MKTELEKKTILTGAESVSYAMKQINPDVVSVFPITPQTEIMMNFSQFVADGEVDTELILVEGEHSAMGAAVGASSAGVRVMTATSSAGLAYMFEVLGIASGYRLPIVMNVVNRALSGPINIHCDHSDSMSARDTGWIQIYSENAQEAYDNTLIGLKLAEKVKLPIMIMQDGFISSHCLQNIELINNKKVKKFIGEYTAENTLFNFKNPITFGPLQLTDYYFETKVQQENAIMNVFKELKTISKEFSEISNRKFEVVTDYFCSNAEYVIIAVSSVCGMIKNVVDKLRKEKNNVGLLKINLFRPFPYSIVAEKLKNAKRIIVLDRSMSFGANAPIYGEIKNSLYGTKNKEINSVVFGLGGRDISEKDIESLFMNMINNENISKYKGVRK